MAGAQPEDFQQLAWEFERSAKERRSGDQAPQVFRALGRRMLSRLASSKHPINSVAAIELAFEATLNDFINQLSPYAQHQLLEYMVDSAPAQIPGYGPDDPYFNAALASFGTDAVFNHVVRGVVLSDPDQLVIDLGDGHGPEGTS